MVPDWLAGQETREVQGELRTLSDLLPVALGQVSCASSLPPQLTASSLKIHHPDSGISGGASLASIREAQFGKLLLRLASAASSPRSPHRPQRRGECGGSASDTSGRPRLLLSLSLPPPPRLPRPCRQLLSFIPLDACHQNARAASASGQDGLGGVGGGEEKIHRWRLSCLPCSASDVTQADFSSRRRSSESSLCSLCSNSSGQLLVFVSFRP
eukprot:447880-Hanusia_phi.AAC.5